MIIRELRVTYVPRTDLPRHGTPFLTGPFDMASLLVPILGSEAVEVFVVLCLNAKRRLIDFHELGRGSVSTVHVSPADVFKVALLANAPAFAIAHNHPSGDPLPSADDMALTQRIAAGAVLMDLQFLDHVIVGEDRYYSFLEGGRL